MARTVQREGAMTVSVRTEGAIILPKKLREKLDLRAGDQFDVEIVGRDIVLHPRPAGRLVLRGVPASSQKIAVLGIGGDAVKDKKKLYER